MFMHVYVGQQSPLIKLNVVFCTLSKFAFRGCHVGRMGPMNKFEQLGAYVIITDNNAGASKLQLDILLYYGTVKVLSECQSVWH